MTESYHQDKNMSDEDDRSQFADSGYDMWDSLPVYGIGAYRLLALIYDGVYPMWVIGRIAECVEMLTKFSERGDCILSDNEGFGKTFFLGDMVCLYDHAYPKLMCKVVAELTHRLRHERFVTEAEYIEREFVPLWCNAEREGDLNPFRAMFGIPCLDNYRGNRFYKFIEKIQEDVEFLKRMDTEYTDKTRGSYVPKDLLRAWVAAGCPVDKNNVPYVTRINDMTEYLEWCEDVCPHCKFSGIMSTGGGIYEPPDYEPICGRYFDSMSGGAPCGSCKGHGFRPISLVYEEEE
ncbi:MAG: hypothetical protein WC262_11785 [Bacteroidales bacterium]|jgi:hypothetical protein